MAIPPKVSVCMITYNHEKFIREAIEGVLMQECDFEVELILANDCSTDTTNEVIQNILKNHPRSHWINYNNHIINKGMMPNFIWALQECKGNYIALCDGDDYWTDALKLQKQVDFMETNKNYAACFHNATVINDGNDLIGRFCDWNSNREIQAEDVILKGGGICPSASILFRNKIHLPSFTLTTKAGDSALAFTLLGFGDFYYLKEVMCVYRKHEGGVYTSINNNKEKKLADIKSNIKLLIDFRAYYGDRFMKFFNKAIQKQLLRVSNTYGFNQVLIMVLTGFIYFGDAVDYIVLKLKSKYLN